MAQQTRDKVLAGRYRVLERLGSGGMAAVYLAEDQRLGRRVAAKVLHADSPEDMARRFDREAKLLASLNHPNVVSVFDTVTDEGRVLIVMEYVEGESLSQALARGPLEPGRAVEVVRGVAAALDHAHAHGVVHRDVKPANVLLGHSGAVKLADLGIATAAERTQITRTGTVLGTPSYMAPEQLAGGELRSAVDVYALAAVAFEALAGRKARDGRTPLEIAHRVASEPPPDLRDAWPAAPDAAARVLQRGMARDPAERPRSAGALADELADALRQEPRPTTATVPLAGAAGGRGLRPWVPLGFLLVAAVAVLLALGAADDPADKDGSVAPPSQRPERERPAEQAPTDDPVAEGIRLNDEGFGLMQQGRYGDAIQLLRRSTDLLQGSGRIEYAYALFNLGRSLRLAGRPDEAIPILERRLEIPNQTGEVRAELEAAREAAGVGEAEDEEEEGGPGKSKGRAKKND